MGENVITSAVDHMDWLQPVQEKGIALVKDAYGSLGSAAQPVKDALHGVWLGHPLHPAVTDVPIGSWTAAAVLDLLDMAGSSQFQPGADAAIAVGLVSAVPAALSGMTDWSDTGRKAQRTGALHGLVNMAAATLYAGSLIARQCGGRGLGRLLGFGAYGCVVAGAYLGGEMSYSQKVGVNTAPDIEEQLPQEFTPALPSSELQEGRPTKATIDCTDIFLLRRGGEILAMADRCSHAGGPLHEGKLEGDSIICPWHGSYICLRTGYVEHGPATQDQPVLDAKEENGQVLVRVRKRS